MKSVWPYLVHISAPIYLSTLQCWSSLFVLASAATYSYFLMVPVIFAVFPYLLPQLNPKNIQIAFTQFWKIRGLPSVTHVFSTFSQWQEINDTLPDIDRYYCQTRHQSLYPESCLCVWFHNVFYTKSNHDLCLTATDWWASKHNHKKSSIKL